MIQQPRDSSTQGRIRAFKATTLRVNREVFLDGFGLHQRTRNLSPSTIRVASEVLGSFLKSHDPLKATKSDIRLHLADLQARCRPATVWTAWRHLRAFYKWLEAEGDIQVNPMTDIPKPVVPPTEVAVLTAEQVRLLLSTCKGSSLVDRRDRALLTIMLDSGIRLSEVAGLTIDDIGQDNCLRIYGKGRKWRTVPLGDNASLALHRWLRLRGGSAGPLWTGRRGPLGTTGIRRVVAKRGKCVGLELHPHMLRHTFVDMWLRNGGNVVDLARLCGWTSVRMAEVYARNHAEERAIRAHDRVRPLDSLNLSRETRKSY